MVAINRGLGTNYAVGRKCRICIVVPTYNEAKNIQTLLDTIFGEEQSKTYGEENIAMNVLVVDDNSPDGTANLVRSYMGKNSNVFLLKRNRKEGLGAAYVSGMQHAIDILDPDVIFEMDADLSHDPKYIFPMVEQIRSGADFVVGSRYVSGGSIPSNWGLSRKIISRAANFYAKMMLGIKNVSDCTGGFRAIKTSVLEKIDVRRLDAKGYAFQISLLHCAIMNNFAVTEVPIDFKDRTFGESKMRISDIIEVGTLVIKMAFRERVLQDVFIEEPKIASHAKP